MREAFEGHCWRCGQLLTGLDYGRETLCPGCTHPTRVCRNCRLYAPGRPNDCLEPLAEPVKDKGRANFCEHFDPAERPLSGPVAPAAGDQRAAAEALFRK